MAGLLVLSLFSSAAAADPLTIDVTKEIPAAGTYSYGPGTTTNPRGEAITVDQRCVFLDGKPWIPVAGEFHYTRYPREEWRDELLKMKSGGLNTVSIYVFWIHQEETQDEFDWSGRRSLRYFLQLCQQVGLKAIVRLGPWVHGEARNGGFPDWVQNSGVRLHSDYPAFLALVAPLYRQMAGQMQGLLWKTAVPSSQSNWTMKLAIFAISTP